MSVERDYAEPLGRPRPKRNRVQRLMDRKFNDFISRLALVGLVFVIVSMFFTRDEIHVDQDGNCVRKVEITLFDEVTHPCSWKKKGFFDEVIVSSAAEN